MQVRGQEFLTLNSNEKIGKWTSAKAKGARRGSGGSKQY